MKASTTARSGKTPKRRAQITVRIDPRLAALLFGEAEHKNVEASVLAREHLERSITNRNINDGILSRLDRLDEILSTENPHSQHILLREELISKIAELAHIQAEFNGQLEALATDFKNGFESLTNAFLILQAYIEKYGVRR